MGLQDLGAGVGSWIGGMLVEGDARELEDKVLQFLQQNMDEYGNIDPNVLKEVEAITQGGTEFDKIKQDPSLRAAQMQALQQMQQVANEGGMTAIDRARLQGINNDINQQQQARRQAMMTQAAQRGQMGSGLMYANMLGSEQAAAEAAAQQGYQVQAEAQKRALDAMQRAGQLGGDIRGQDYGIARDRAGAQDRINQYNADLRNKMNQYNMDNRQRNYQNDISLRDRRADVRDKQGAVYQGRADNTRQQGRAAGSAIGGGLGAAGDFAVGVTTGVNPGGLGGFGKGLYDKEEEKKKNGGK